MRKLISNETRPYQQKTRVKLAQVQLLFFWIYHVP